MFVCLLQNIVARSPLIFITLAEVHPINRLHCSINNTANIFCNRN